MTYPLYTVDDDRTMSLSYRTIDGFNEELQRQNYEGAVKLLNAMSEYDYNKGPIDNMYYRQALIQFASVPILLHLGWKNVDVYPELLNSLQRYQNLDWSEQDSILLRDIADMISDGGYDSEGSDGVMANKALSIIVNNGFLNPNITISDEPIFQIAANTRNANFMNTLLNKPNFVVIPEYLTYINSIYQPIDYVRETLISRLRPMLSADSRSRKRTRYSLDE